MADPVVASTGDPDFSMFAAIRCSSPVVPMCSDEISAK